MNEWFYPSEIPSGKSHDFKIFSIEVLIFFPNRKSHCIGWYNFRDKKWELLSNEKDEQDFAWRYLQKDIDQDFKDSAKLKWYYNSEIPDVINPTNENESMEVLIYTYPKKYNAIGKYNYEKSEWESVFNEQLHYTFVWRYLELELDTI